MDDLTPDQRRRAMQAVKSKNTGPEMQMRKALRDADLTGYRLHLRNLPGRPDIAFTRWKVAIFVDGGFWHGLPERWHPDRASEFWVAKIARNMERDRAADRLLEDAGWTVLRFWDTDVKKEPARCAERVRDALCVKGRGKS